MTIIINRSETLSEKKLRETIDPDNPTKAQHAVTHLKRPDDEPRSPACKLASGSPPWQLSEWRTKWLWRPSWETGKRMKGRRPLRISRRCKDCLNKSNRSSLMREERWWNSATYVPNYLTVREDNSVPTNKLNKQWRRCKRFAPNGFSSSVTSREPTWSSTGTSTTSITISNRRFRATTPIPPPGRSHQPPKRTESLPKSIKGKKELTPCKTDQASLRRRSSKDKPNHALQTARDPANRRSNKNRPSPRATRSQAGRTTSQPLVKSRIRWRDALSNSANRLTSKTKPWLSSPLPARPSSRTRGWTTLPRTLATILRIWSISNSHHRIWTSCSSREAPVRYLKTSLRTRKWPTNNSSKPWDTPTINSSHPATPSSSKWLHRANCASKPSSIWIRKLLSKRTIMGRRALSWRARASQTKTAT